ncbi:MAG: class I SAM-dependent methyltransferase, partial [Pseudomonadota bacterium]|nr:class I SAM-dependent methyltransferase [Pseudomonadota bacterium]
TNTLNAQDFGVLRTPESVPWAAGATTPVLQYPDMTRTVTEHLVSLDKTEEFARLGDELEYRYRTRTVAEWLALAETEHTENNQLKTFLQRVLTGQRDPENKDGCMWLFDKEKDWVDVDGAKVFKPNPLTMYRYSRWLKAAYEFATHKEDPYDLSEKINITLSYVEVRFSGTDVHSRGFMFPSDSDSKPDLSDRPFALCHPPTNSVEYHLGKCHDAFEAARRCTGDVGAKIRKILGFTHVWSVTMPYARGSAADNEFLTTALFVYHKLGLPKRDVLRKADEYAQASFTAQQFANKMLELGIEELDPLPFTMEEFLKTLIPAALDEQALALRKSEEEKAELTAAKGNTVPKEYPDSIFGVSAKPGMYVLDNLVHHLNERPAYFDLLNYITGHIKGIVSRIPGVDADAYQRLQVPLAKLAPCETAFTAALMYQSDDATTYENIKRYYELYNETKPYAEGTEMVNNLLFQALCLHNNIVPQLMDGTSLISPQKPDAPLINPLFKGRHVVATTQETADRISGHLNETFDPAARTTQLCEIMKRHGSDKSTVHNYTRMYQFLLESKRETATNVFEIGIASTDPQFAYTMGKDGTVGASLRGWREFFPNARIYGADIDAKALFQEERINTYFVDQLKTDAISTMFAQIPVAGFDVMIDDGLHCFEANDIFFKAAIDKLTPGGIYIIEDIAPRGVPLVLKLLEEISGEYDAAFIQLPTAPARFDNNIFVVFKKAIEV